MNIKDSFIAIALHRGEGAVKKGYFNFLKLKCRRNLVGEKITTPSQGGEKRSSMPVATMRFFRAIDSF
jgi:hypothetical protein